MGRGNVQNHISDVIDLGQGLFSGTVIGTYRSDMSTDHESYVLGEGMNQLEQGRTRVWISSQNQTLRPVNKKQSKWHQTQTSRLGLFLVEIQIKKCNFPQNTESLKCSTATKSQPEVLNVILHSGEV